MRSSKAQHLFVQVFQTLKLTRRKARRSLPNQGSNPSVAIPKFNRQVQGVQKSGQRVSGLTRQTQAVGTLMHGKSFQSQIVRRRARKPVKHVRSLTQTELATCRIAGAQQIGQMCRTQAGCRCRIQCGVTAGHGRMPCQFKRHSINWGRRRPCTGVVRRWGTENLFDQRQRQPVQPRALRWKLKIICSVPQQGMTERVD